MKTRPDDFIQYYGQDADGIPLDGLKKREYFALHAPINELIRMYYDKPCGTFKQCAELAVNYADALIEELNK